jgi:hypothetical protein
MHYRRSKEDPEKLLEPKKQTSTYQGAHKRVLAMWGKAKQYLCAVCGNQAQQWAYDGTDPEQLYDASWPGRSHIFFSLYPEFYLPLCTRCHRTKDCADTKEELRDYRSWRHRHGLTTKEARDLLNQFDPKI